MPTNDYVEVAFDPSRHCSLAVLHRDADGCPHIHVLHARIDLETGMSHNVAPPRHENAFNTLRDYMNYSHGWDRPDDPELSRLVQPSHCLEAHQLRDTWSIGEPTSRARVKAQITDFILLRVGNGSVNNRAEMVSALEELGEVTRQGSDYLSIKIDGFEKAIRLKGTLFNEQFNTSTYRQNSRKESPDRGAGSLNSNLDSASATRNRRRADPEHQRLAAEAFERFEAAVASRTEYNTRYYQKRDRNSVPDHQSDDATHPSTQPDCETKLDSDGLVVCNLDGFERSIITNATGNRLDTHAHESDGRGITSDEQLDRFDRSALDDLPIQAGQPQSMQTYHEVKESTHEPERVTDDFAEYLAGINADYQRAAAHTHATTQELLKVREKRRADAKQRVEELAQINCERDAHRRTQQLRPDLTELREQSEGLRRGAEQQGGFIDQLRAFRDRFITAIGIARDQVNRFIEKIRLEPKRLSPVINDVTHSYPNYVKNAPITPVVNEKVVFNATQQKDDSNDFTH